MLLEDIEAGSIKIWLRNLLRTIDDSNLKDLDWRKIVGNYLVKAKYYILDFLEGKTTIVDKSELKEIESKLFNLAKDTDVVKLPAYSQISRNKLLISIHKISESVRKLGPKDKAYYIDVTEVPKELKVPLNIEFNILPEKIEELSTKEIIKQEIMMIFKVKKPDYLGTSMWEFRHANKSFEAKILDEDWLKKFQSRKIHVRPGDSLKCMVRLEVHYDDNNEVAFEKYYILKVEEVIPPIEEKQLEIETVEGIKEDK